VKAFIIGLALLLGGCASGVTRYPHSYFTFEGVAEKISPDTYLNVHGEERGVLVRIVRLERGNYRDPEIWFGFPAGDASPLTVGRSYRITAAWGRHGMMIMQSAEIAAQNPPKKSG
jgi:hypothetical protein